MTPKATSHVIQGMQKDTSKSKLGKEFAFDAKNIRITAREDNSLLTVTNEKGNEKLIDLSGYYLGHCVLNNQLVLFTTTPNEEKKDHIFLYDSNFVQTPLYDGNLNFNLDNPLETLGVYENERIQKVYWVDSINQPRVINIKASEEIKLKWSDSSFDFIPELALQESVSVEAISNSSMFAPGVIQYAFSYYNKYGQESCIFNVSPLCFINHNNRGGSPEEIVKSRSFKIILSNIDTNFEYVRLYSIHRTSLNGTPTVKRIIDLPTSKIKTKTTIEKSTNSYIGSANLKFKLRKDVVLPPESIDYNDRLLSSIYSEGSPNYTVKETTYIKETIISFLDPNFNLYNIVDEQVNIDGIITDVFLSTEIPFTFTIRENKKDKATSYIINSTKEFIVSYELENKTNSIEYIDSGNLGDTIDPSLLLYIGGEDIIAGTITQKDNTLFLGNIEFKQLSIPQELKDKIHNLNIGFDTKNISDDNSSLYSSNDFSIDSSYFKTREHYRIGLQFQYKTGKWSEPIFLNDKTQVNTPSYDEDKKEWNLPVFSVLIPDDIKKSLKDLGFYRARGLVVFPDTNYSKVLTQGILCPTVYQSDARESNKPHSQASWFARPNYNEELETSWENINETSDRARKGALVEFRHGFETLIKGNRGAEIRGSNKFVIDQSFLNLYSPEIEMGYIGDITNKDVEMRIVGIANFTSNYSDLDILTSTTGGKFERLNVQSADNGGIGLCASCTYMDDTGDTVDFYLVYPWDHEGSLLNSEEETDKAILLKKRLSNIKYSKYNTWFNKDLIWKSSGGNSSANGISNIELFNSTNVELSKIKDNKEVLNYYGNIDTLLTGTKNFAVYVATSDPYGSMRSDTNVIPYCPIRMKYKTAPHFVFKLNKYLNSDKEIILPSINSINKVGYTPSKDNIDFSEYGVQVKYEVYSVWSNVTGNEPPVYPIDAVVGDLCVHYSRYEEQTSYMDYYYESTSIYIEQLNDEGKWVNYTDTDKAYILKGKNVIDVFERHPYSGWIVHENQTVTSSPIDVTVIQDNIDISSLPYPYLFIAEFYNNEKSIVNAFGGTSEEAIKNNLWFPASPPYQLDNTNRVKYTYGDTRYQRYDCLKTYAYTPEDSNQIVEIISFMCECRINLTGRYDKNIGNLSNLNADPTNFNLFNPVYSQKNNFFNYRILDSDMYKLDKFTNTITWSKEKFVGEDVDTWTNITMANTVDLDGTKGKVNKLITFKDQIFAFQDKGVSNILFNSRVQIPVSDGVPIEITNGYKVDGYRYISDSIGCQNKNSIIATSSGVYFLDSESNGIYLLADGLTNLSTNKGFDIWTKEVSKDPSFKSFYDKNERDVYFITKDYCLGYSEKLGQFTSFYDYTDVETMFNIGTGFYSIKSDSEGDQSIYQHSVGNYNEFYGEIKPYHLTIISNEDPQVDKVFTNLDYRADFFDSNNKYLENESFDTLEVWNEYQSGKETLKYSKFRPSNLKKKFRIWSANIPRDKKNKLDRMRNPWLHIKLSKNNPGTSKMELHDIVVKYLE